MITQFSSKFNRVAGNAFRGLILVCPPESSVAVEAVEWTIRIRTAFAAIGAAVSTEAASSGGPFETLRSTASHTRALSHA